MRDEQKLVLDAAVRAVDLGWSYPCRDWREVEALIVATCVNVRYPNKKRAFVLDAGSKVDEGDGYVLDMTKCIARHGQATRFAVRPEPFESDPGTGVLFDIDWIDQVNEHIKPEIGVFAFVTHPELRRFVYPVGLHFIDSTLLEMIHLEMWANRPREVPA